MNAHVFILGFASSYSSITLWQFGTDRLAPGQTTLPLSLAGVATDGLATTYIYQFATSVVTESHNGTSVVEPLGLGEVLQLSNQ